MKEEEIYQICSAYVRRTLFYYFFIMFYCALVYTRFTKINYKTVPVTNFNKHLHYGASRNE